MTVRQLACLSLLGALTLSTQPAETQDVRLGGFLQLERRVNLTDSVRFADFYNIFRPELNAKLGGGAEVVVSMDMRFHDFTGVASTDELEDASRHFPNSSAVWEAFARLPAFVVRSLDLTVGKQRIQWGTADGLNPTDRFNAYDLSDLTDFTGRIPVWAVRGEYYATPAWKVEAVWAPTTHGPLLPQGLDGLFAAPGVGLPPVPIASWNGQFEPPPPEPRNSQYGFKVAGAAAGVDISASYFHGFDGLPVIRGVKLTNSGSVSGVPSFEAEVSSGLPRIQALGGDLATEWRGIGIWAEGAVLHPERVVFTVDVITAHQNVRTEGLAIDGKRYATWTVGGDYTFPGGWYLNLQWAHGLFLERGRDQLHDYLIGKFERRLLRETVTVSFTGVAEASRWSDWSDNTGWGLYPDLRYSLVDNLDVSVGGLLAGGRGNALFGRFDDVDQAYLRVRVTF